MDAFLEFCTNNFIILLVTSLLFLFGIAGYFVDYNTNILSIEKKKKALVKKNMNINEIKKQIKDKNTSLSGIAGNNEQSVNQPKLNTNNVNSTESLQEEDLSVPFNLDIK